MLICQVHNSRRHERPDLSVLWPYRITQLMGSTTHQSDELPLASTPDLEVCNVEDNAVSRAA